MAEAALSVPVRDWDDYVALEERTGERHELIEGVAYAMVGGSAAHNVVAMNIAAALHGAAPAPCQVFQQGMKLRVRTGTAENFLYPDVMLCCDPDDAAEYWRDRPRLIAEVLSPGSERIDLGEKFLRYQAIDSLQEYLVVRARAAEAFVFRRSAGWKRSELDLDQGGLLETLPLRLDFETLYRGVTF